MRRVRIILGKTSREGIYCGAETSIWRCGTSIRCAMQDALTDAVLAIRGVRNFFDRVASIFTRSEDVGNIHLLALASDMEFYCFSRGKAGEQSASTARKGMAVHFGDY